MAGGAGVDATGRDVMQGDDFGSGAECSMAAVALETGQGEEVTVFLLVAHRVAGDAFYSQRRRRAGEALAPFNRIFDELRVIDAMADDAIAAMNDEGVSHAGRDMAGGAA